MKAEGSQDLTYVDMNTFLVSFSFSATRVGTGTMCLSCKLGRLSCLQQPDICPPTVLPSLDLRIYSGSESKNQNAISQT